MAVVHVQSFCTYKLKDFFIFLDKFDSHPPINIDNVLRCGEKVEFDFKNLNFSALLYELMADSFSFAVRQFLNIIFSSQTVLLMAVPSYDYSSSNIL